MEIEYFNLAWKVYYYCAAAIISSQLCLFWIFPKKVVLFIMALSSCILFTNYEMVAEITWQVPALMVVVMDFFILHKGDWPNALKLLLENIAILIFISLCLLGISFFFKSKEQKHQDLNNQLFAGLD